MKKLIILIGALSLLALGSISTHKSAPQRLERAAATRSVVTAPVTTSSTAAAPATVTTTKAITPASNVVTETTTVKIDATYRETNGWCVTGQDVGQPNDDSCVGDNPTPGKVFGFRTNTGDCAQTGAWEADQRNLVEDTTCE